MIRYKRFKYSSQSRAQSTKLADKVLGLKMCDVIFDKTKIMNQKKDGVE